MMRDFSFRGTTLRSILAWAIPVLAALAGMLYWWWLGVPVTLPSAPSARMGCVSYTPFHQRGESPFDPRAFVTPQQINHDLARLAQRFDCVRTYSQSQGLDAVPMIAKRYGMHVLLGIWLSADKTANTHEVALGIHTALAYPKTVRAIVVGNEVLLRGDLAPKRLVAYIRQVRAATHMPVTYADVWEFWLRYAHQAGLEQAVSFVTVHILPYWENDPVPIGHAVDYVNRIYTRMQRAFPGKRIVIGETGWPSEGKPRGDAVPSRVNEARFVRGFLRDASARHIPYNLIEAFDQPWKRQLEGTVGGYWGLFNSHANPKFPLRGPVVEVHRWWLGWLAGGMVGLLFAVSAAGREWRLRLLAFAAGMATGMALAEAARQMLYAMQSPWAWAAGVLVCVVALLTALACTRDVNARLRRAANDSTNSSRVRRVLVWFASPRMYFLWLFAIAWMDLLLVFDGRYRDYPDAAFLIPALAIALGRAVTGARAVQHLAEYRLLALWSVLAAIILLIHAHAANTAVWSWALCNVLLATPAIIALAGSRSQLQAQQPEGSNQ